MWLNRPICFVFDYITHQLYVVGIHAAGYIDYLDGKRKSSLPKLTHSSRIQVIMHYRLPLTLSRESGESLSGFPVVGIENQSLIQLHHCINYTCYTCLHKLTYAYQNRSCYQQVKHFPFTPSSDNTLLWSAQSILYVSLIFQPLYQYLVHLVQNRLV